MFISFRRRFSIRKYSLEREGFRNFHASERAPVTVTQPLDGSSFGVNQPAPARR